MRSLRSRPTLTDSTDALERQAAAYAASAPEAALSAALVDSAFVARDLRSKRCRDFHAALGCAWFDEIVCHSDRDQLSFPIALRRLGLTSRRPWALDAVVEFERAGDDAPLAVIVPPGGRKQPSFHWCAPPSPPSFAAASFYGLHPRYYTHALAAGKCLACIKDRADARRGDLDRLSLA